ncbi:Phosphatidylinositol 4,5-bisphosphate-binding protein SLM1 [Ceratocystis fimbriata CBS 114723]|uniref:Phosphatidylinositol 4,5-bisphosphate-binding protein SLM1 n=1 Tax=Ceratocystis fimbriata CBS 114723 TaxID=1035309 RepID=A0A2C5XML5_9PEZI|nr:Phosphatidylinositol 4,5-bisphosphate-binding protein SLM1 [Ceratocystis fimbriata CBS 114723]
MATRAPAVKDTLNTAHNVASTTERALGSATNDSAPRSYPEHSSAVTDAYHDIEGNKSASGSKFSEGWGMKSGDGGGSKHSRGVSTSSADHMILSSRTGNNSHLSSGTMRDHDVPGAHSTATHASQDFRSGSRDYNQEQLSSPFHCPIPTDTNPSEILASRFEEYRQILKDLIAYFKETGNHYESRAKAHQRLQQAVASFTMPQEFLQTKGLSDGLGVLQSHSRLAVNEAEKSQAIEEDVIAALTSLRSELSSKIKEIRNLAGDFKSNIEQEIDNTKKSVRSLNDAISQNASGTEPSVTGKSDPYLLRHSVDRQVEKQLKEENYIQQAHINLETSGRELESIVVYEIQKSFNAIAGMLKRESTLAYNTSEDLRSGVISMPRDAEWDHWLKSRDDMFLTNVPRRTAQQIIYPGMDHPSCHMIRSGPLERKGKYLKSFTAGWYVLLPTHLHEFKSADSPTPVMSLYLPDQTLGSHSASGGSNNKFILKGRQTGTLHRGHTWIFRAESYQDMLGWYKDIKDLLEPSAQTAGSSGGAALGSAALQDSEAPLPTKGNHKRTTSSYSSTDSVLDEEDETPWAGINCQNSPELAAAGGLSPEQQKSLAARGFNVNGGATTSDPTPASSKPQAYKGQDRLRTYPSQTGQTPETSTSTAGLHGSKKLDTDSPQATALGLDPSALRNENATASGLDPTVLRNENATALGLDPFVILRNENATASGLDPTVLRNENATASGLDPTVLRNENATALGLDPSALRNKNDTALGLDPSALRNKNISRPQSSWSTEEIRSASPANPAKTAAGAGAALAAGISQKDKQSKDIATAPSKTAAGASSSTTMGTSARADAIQESETWNPLSLGTQLESTNISSPKSAANASVPAVGSAASSEDPKDITESHKYPGSYPDEEIIQDSSTHSLGDDVGTGTTAGPIPSSSAPTTVPSRTAASNASPVQSQNQDYLNKPRSEESESSNPSSTSIIGTMMGAVGLGGAAAAMSSSNKNSETDQKESGHADRDLNPRDKTVSTQGIPTDDGTPHRPDISKAALGSSDALPRNQQPSSTLQDRTKAKGNGKGTSQPGALGDVGKDTQTSMSTSTSSSAPKPGGTTTMPTPLTGTGVSPADIGGPNPMGSEGASDGPNLSTANGKQLDVNPDEPHVLGDSGRPKAWSMVGAAEKELRELGQLPDDKTSSGPVLAPTGSHDRRSSFSLKPTPRTNESIHYQMSSVPGQLIPTSENHRRRLSQVSTVDPMFRRESLNTVDPKLRGGSLNTVDSSKSTDPRTSDYAPAGSSTIPPSHTAGKSSTRDALPIVGAASSNSPEYTRQALARKSSDSSISSSDYDSSDVRAGGTRNTSKMAATTTPGSATTGNRLQGTADPEKSLGPNVGDMLAGAAETVLPSTRAPENASGATLGAVPPNTNTRDTAGIDNSPGTYGDARTAQEQNTQSTTGSGAGLGATVAAALGAGAAALGLTTSHDDAATSAEQKDKEYSSSISSSSSDYEESHMPSRDSWAPASAYKNSSEEADNTYRMAGGSVPHESEQFDVPPGVTSKHVHPQYPHTHAHTPVVAAKMANKGPSSYHMKSGQLDHPRDDVSGGATLHQGTGSASRATSKVAFGTAPTATTRPGTGAATGIAAGAAVGATAGAATLAAHNHSKSPSNTASPDNSELSEEWSGPWNRDSASNANHPMTLKEELQETVREREARGLGQSGSSMNPTQGTNPATIGSDPTFFASETTDSTAATVGSNSSQSTPTGSRAAPSGLGAAGAMANTASASPSGPTATTGVRSTSIPTVTGPEAASLGDNQPQDAYTIAGAQDASRSENTDSSQMNFSSKDYGMSNVTPAASAGPGPSQASNAAAIGGESSTAGPSMDKPLSTEPAAMSQANRGDAGSPPKDKHLATRIKEGSSRLFGRNKSKRVKSRAGSTDVPAPYPTQ